MSRGPSRSWLSPLALKELLVPGAHGDDVTPAALISVTLAALLAVAWVVPHPLMLQVRHAPVVLACVLTLVLLLGSIQRARAVLDERSSGTYETLILAGASGLRFVAGMVQANVLKGLQPMALALPAFAACLAAVGTPPQRVAGFYLVLLAQLVLASALGVLGASEPPSAIWRRASAASAGFRISAAAFLLPLLSAALMLPTLLLAVRGLPREALPAGLGEAVFLPLLFCAPATFVVSSIRIAGFDVPFLPLAVFANLAAALIPLVRAAARHRLHRHDRGQERRALTAAAYAVTFALVAAALASAPAARAAASAGAAFPPLVVLALVHLAMMMAIAPDATAPAWPGTAAGDTPGRGRLADLFRERSGTGLVFVSLLSLAAAPFYALVVPAAGRTVAVFVWLYVTVCAMSWAMVSFELPSDEPQPRAGLGLRAAVLLLSAISLATVLWDETLVEKQNPWLVLPVRIALGAAVLSTPLSGLLGLSTMLVALPLLRRGSLAGAATLLYTSPAGLFWMSLAWHAVLAIGGWLRARWLTAAPRRPRG